MDNAEVQQQNSSGKYIAILTMMFLYGMVSFVTNLAAPMGNVWVYQPGIDGNHMLGMMGNMMNFLAYLFMGIPAGKMLTKVGYKKTALIAIATGFVGVAIQFLSGIIGVGSTIGSLPANWFVYLLGAFVCGFSVCMLNTVVNPMLNTLGGGGNRGNQLNMIGTTFNSVCGTATPMLVGALIGSVTDKTQIQDVNLVLYIAMAVFAAAFFALLFIPIANPAQVKKDVVYERSPLAFRHCLLGVIGIFIYVGIEVGIPGTLNFWLAKTDGDFAKLNPTNFATIAGFVAGTYWFLMLIGRIVGSFIGGKVSSRVMLTVTSAVGIALIAVGTQTTTVMTSMPVFNGHGFAMTTVPLTALLFVLCGLCTSIMWASIFNLSVEGLGKYTEMASGLFMVMVVGGGVLPLVQNAIADKAGFMLSYVVPGLGLAYLLVYALFFSKNVNKDIKVD